MIENEEKIQSRLSFLMTNQKMGFQEPEWINLKTNPKTSQNTYCRTLQARTIPNKEYMGWLKNRVKRRAFSSDMKRVITLPPSKGGKGRRLKSKRIRFNTKNTLNNFAMPSHMALSAMTNLVRFKRSLVKSCETSGEEKIPTPNPILIKINAIRKIMKLAVGPAAAIQAARRGYLAAQCGSYGALAQPIIQPIQTKEIIGTSTVPKGERIICGIGFRVT